MPGTLVPIYKKILNYASNPTLRHSKQLEICEATVPANSSEALRGGFRCAVVRALLFDVLLEQRRQVGRVALQHGGCVGGQHREPADQFALDNSD